jgi:hypothetical protein
LLLIYKTMNLKHIYSLITCALLVFVTACSPDEFNLGNANISADDLVEGIAYTVDVDQATNTVTMKSLLGSSYVTSWIHPQGASTGETATIRVPFAGDYQVKFGVMTRAGMVYGEPCNITINNTNGELLTDPIWINLTGGGQGCSKTWRISYVDGVTTGFAGPFYFKGTDDCWESITLGRVLGDGADSWSWDADASCLDWIGINPANFGNLTFDLIDGAHVAVNGVASGSYTVDTDNHKLNLPETAAWYDADAPAFAQDWYNIKLLSLDEYTMQIGIIRASDPCLICINYVADGWNGVYPDGGGIANSPVVDPYDGDANSNLTTTTTTEKVWNLVEDAPYDWYWWNGASAQWESNNFASASDYGKSWCPAVDEDQISDFSLTMSKKDANSGTFIANTVGGEVSGTYTTSGNKIKFSKNVTWLRAVGSAATINITTNELSVVKYEEGEEMWLGASVNTDAKGNTTEYLCIKVKEKKSSSSTENGTRVVCDNSKILYGDLEGNSNLRVEIFNAWGSGTASNAPIDITKIKYKQSIKVTFTVTGIGTLSTPVTAFLMNSLGNVWNATDSGSVTANITKDGTYTVSTTGKASGADASSFVFCIDMVGMGNATSTDLTTGDDHICPNVKVTIDSIWLDQAE